MTIPALAKKLSGSKPLLILGINSGTSADGIDLALIEYSYLRRGHNVKFITGESIPYSRTIKAELERNLSDDRKELEMVARLDIAYGLYLGKVAREFLKRHGLKVDAIASHGQTIGHYPAKRKQFGMAIGSTVQIGDGNALAAESGLSVITDFRRTDIAGGGEGAPLTPFVNHLLFGDKRKSRIIVNIGGIANYSYHPTGGTLDYVRGGDCGPGNIISDLACQLLFHIPYDRDGEIAKAGRLNKQALGKIFVANAQRKISAGREQFDHRLLARVVHAVRRDRGNHNDVVTSIAEATVRLIHRSLRGYQSDKKLEAVYLTGGGRSNLYFVERLTRLLHPAVLLPIEALGYDGDLLEAVSFAVLGGCFLASIPSTLPGVTGAAIGGIAGKLSLPPI